MHKEKGLQRGAKKREVVRFCEEHGLKIEGGHSHQFIRAKDGKKIRLPGHDGNNTIGIELVRDVEKFVKEHGD